MINTKYLTCHCFSMHFLYNNNQVCTIPVMEPRFTSTPYDEPRGEDLELKPTLDTKTFYKPTAQNLNDILQMK